jgi:hypothetical protein
MNGVVIEQMSTLEEACEADAVIVGSGVATREVVEDQAIMGVLRRLDPSRQLIAAQCSGVLVLARLGLLNGIPACTDLITRPWVAAAGVDVLDQPFFARGNLATAGGCLASPYLAAWLIARLRGTQAAENALRYVAPVGEKEEYIARAWRNLTPYLPAEPAGGPRGHQADRRDSSDCRTTRPPRTSTEIPIIRSPASAPETNAVMTSRARPGPATARAWATVIKAQVAIVAFLRPARTACSTTANVLGSTAAAPAPVTARLARSSGTFGAMADISPPAANRVRPASRTPLRPNRLPAAPPGITRQAKKIT